MAMTGNAMGTAIINAINALADEDKLDQDKLLKAFSGAIVDYIVANAAVVVTSVSGVTTGAGVSGAGTGTIT